MEFGAIILENMGKDIYIGIEIPQKRERREVVIHNYRAAAPDQKAYAGEETVFIFPEREWEKGVELGMTAKVDRWSRLFDLIDIEARYQRYFYHIYIMNCISIQNSRRFAGKEGGRVFERV